MHTTIKLVGAAKAARCGASQPPLAAAPCDQQNTAATTVMPAARIPTMASHCQTETSNQVARAHCGKERINASGILQPLAVT